MYCIVIFPSVCCSEVAKDLQCNLCAYDYTGYGQSSGRASVADTIADVDAVFAWLLRRGVQRQDIILYGQSLGSGPTLDLAARETSIAGVILHAAFASGARIPAQGPASCVYLDCSVVASHQQLHAQG